MKVESKGNAANIKDTQQSIADYDKELELTRLDIPGLEPPPVPARPSLAQLETIITNNKYPLTRKSGNEESPLLDLLNDLDLSYGNDIGVGSALAFDVGPIVSKNEQESEMLAPVGLEPPTPNKKQDSSSTVVEGTASSAHGEHNGSPGPSTATPSSPIRMQKRKFIGKWQLGRTIGQGSSGKVKLAHHIETKEKVHSILIVCCQGRSSAKSVSLIGRGKRNIETKSSSSIQSLQERIIHDT